MLRLGEVTGSVTAKVVPLSEAEEQPVIVVAVAALGMQFALNPEILPAGVPHVPSPRQKVELVAPVPLFSNETGINAPVPVMAAVIAGALRFGVVSVGDVASTTFPVPLTLPETVPRIFSIPEAPTASVCAPLKVKSAAQPKAPALLYWKESAVVVHGVPPPPPDP